jgi:hypothetical protein
MRTAEEILKSNDVAIDRWPDTKALIIKSINEARKEAIEECVKVASKEYLEECYLPILELINELK